MMGKNRAGSEKLQSMMESFINQFQHQQESLQQAHLKISDFSSKKSSRSSSHQQKIRFPTLYPDDFDLTRRGNATLDSTVLPPSFREAEQTAREEGMKKRDSIMRSRLKFEEEAQTNPGFWWLLINIYRLVWKEELRFPILDVEDNGEGESLLPRK
jgi:hypothetical protein